MRVEGGVLAEEVKSGRDFHAGGVICGWQAGVCQLELSMGIV